MAGVAAPTAADVQGPVTGSVPLTPIQAWFFERKIAAAHHFNMPLLFAARQAIDPALLARALDGIVEHHDALRLGFERQADGWRQWNAPPGTPVPLVIHDFSYFGAEAADAAVARAGSELQAGLDLARPPLLRAGLFRRGGGRPDLLLLAVHHLIVDGVSWRILLEDLASAYAQLQRGEALHLPPRTTPFKAWSEKLGEHVRAGRLAAEAGHWLALAGAPTGLPTDHPRGENIAGSARSITVTLSVEETQALLREVPAAYGTEIHEVLLAALVRAMADWTGQAQVLIDLEGHGREDLIGGVDLSRTVGWFTTHFPVLFAAGDAGPAADLKAAKERFRATPHRGIGFGALRYLSPDVALRQALAALPKPGVKFNYLGQLDQALPAGSPFTPAEEEAGPARSPRGERAHLLEIGAGIQGGRLWTRWVYSVNLHDEATIERLAAAFLVGLENLIAHCLAPDSGGYTPADFPEAQLDEQGLEALLAQVGGGDEV